MNHPYEIHITVSGGDVEIFKQVCQQANVKPILLELHSQGGVFEDLQTSSFIRASWDQVKTEIDRIIFILGKSGFKVVRSKVETYPYHEQVPTEKNEQKMPSGCYFESHVQVTISSLQITSLKAVAVKHGAHLSRNAFKKINENQCTIMLTLRDNKVCLEQFIFAVRSLENEIKTLDLDVTKSIIEFALYDTNIHHDDTWLKTTVTPVPN